MGYLLCDFDGTLGDRDGSCSAACVDVLREAEGATDVGVADVRPHRQDGFPRHAPYDPLTLLSNPSSGGGNSISSSPEP